MLRVVLLVVGVVALIVFSPRMLSRATLWSLFVKGHALEAPAVGNAAPHFTLPSQDGSPVSLKDFHGKWVILYFYPKDQTPG